MKSMNKKRPQESNRPLVGASAQRDCGLGTEYFLMLFSANELAIHRFVRMMIRDTNDLDDVSQMVALRLWEKFNRYDPDRPFLPWAFGIASNVVIEHKRKSLRGPRLFEPWLIEEFANAFAKCETSTHLASDQIESLRACLEQLSSRCYALMRRRYFEGKSIEEIALRTQRSKAATYKAVWRTQNRIAECVRLRLSKRKGTP